MLFKELEQTDTINANKSQGELQLFLIFAKVTQKCHRGTFKNCVFPFGESNWCEVALSTAGLVNMKMGQCPINIV